MLSTKHAKLALHILIPLFIGVLSLFVLAPKLPETTFVEESLVSIDQSNNTVMEFAGATLSTSLAISALPDDFGTPLANALADMNIYFVFILIVLFAERLLLVEGIKLSFAIIIPIACGIHILSTLLKSTLMRSLAVKLAILGLSLAMVVPCSTHFMNAIGKDYLAYVDQTISETNAGAEKLNGVMEQEDAEIDLFERLTETFKTAIRGLGDLLNYFQNIIRKCMSSIAILITSNFVLPLVTYGLLRWLLKELFRFELPDRPYYRLRKRHPDGSQSAAELPEEVTV